MNKSKLIIFTFEHEYLIVLFKHLHSLSQKTYRYKMNAGVPKNDLDCQKIIPTSYVRTPVPVRTTADTPKSFRRC